MGADRALTVTWVIHEVRLAMQNCYDVEIFEVYEYAVTQYESQRGEGRLFVEYVDAYGG